MNKKLKYIHDCFLRTSISTKGNVFVFCVYQNNNLTDEKINEYYCYVRYCSIYHKSLFFYNARAGDRFGFTNMEFQRLFKFTNLLNNFNFENYNFFHLKFYAYFHG